MDENRVDRTCWIYTNIKKHLEMKTKEEVYEVISTLTCIPGFLKNVIHEAFSNELMEDYEQPESLKALVYEIVEEFIRNNDFKRKSAWNRKMRKEYNRLKASDIFPELIMTTFGGARQVIRDSLKIDTIKEIKDILKKTAKLIVTYMI